MTQYEAIIARHMHEKLERSHRNGSDEEEEEEDDDDEDNGMR
jgi:hypothetical protein